jgi:hypothetical protein
MTTWLILFLVIFLIFTISILLTINKSSRNYGIILIILSVILTVITIYQFTYFNNKGVQNNIGGSNKLDLCSKKNALIMEVFKKTNAINENLLTFLFDNNLNYKDYYNYLEKYILLQNQKIDTKKFQDDIRTFNFSLELQEKINQFYNETVSKLRELGNMSRNIDSITS